MSRLKDNYINKDRVYDKKTWVAIILLIFVSMSIFGFVVEVIFYHVNALVIYGKSEWYWRGTAFGPWINIYGLGAVCVFFLTYRLRSKPWLVALISGTVLSVVELLTGMVIYYGLNGKRAWNYNEEAFTFGNIGGFLCGRNIVAFILAGPYLIYLVVPLILWIEKKINKKVFLSIAYVLGGIVIADMFYNDILHYVIPGLKDSSDYYKQFGIKYMKFTNHDKAFWKLK